MGEKIKHRKFVMLPPGARKNNKFWIARGSVSGRTVEMSTHTADYESACTVVDRYISRIENPTRIPTHYPTPLSGELPSWAKRLLWAARDRSRDGACKIDLSEADMLEIVRRADGHCEVTGIPFNRNALAGTRRPYAPSLDRINPTAGYTKDNCRLVLFAVNVAMSDWGESVFAHIARVYMGKCVGKIFKSPIPHYEQDIRN